MFPVIPGFTKFLQYASNFVLPEVIIGATRPLLPRIGLGIVSGYIKSQALAGAFGKGVVDAVAGTVISLFKVETYVAMRDMSIAGFAKGNVGIMISTDAIFGTNSYGTSQGFEQYLNESVNTIKSGTWEERFYLAGTIVPEILGTKGVSKLVSTSGKVGRVAAKLVKPPKGWTSAPSKKGGGTLFKDPENPHNNMRVMPGNPNSPNVAQQKPYVIFKKNGIAFDSNGNPLKRADDQAAHIPLDQFDINKMP